MNIYNNTIVTQQLWFIQGSGIFAATSLTELLRVFSWLSMAVKRLSISDWWKYTGCDPIPPGRSAEFRGPMRNAQHSVRVRTRLWRLLQVDIDVRTSMVDWFSKLRAYGLYPDRMVRKILWRSWNRLGVLRADIEHRLDHQHPKCEWCHLLCHCQNPSEIRVCKAASGCSTIEIHNGVQNQTNEGWSNWQIQG